MKFKLNSGIFLAIVAFACFIVFSCKPAPTPTPAPADPLTSLVINVHDGSGIHSVPTPYPKIQLFKSDADRVAKTNPVSNLRSGDGAGNVKFDSLEAINYYYNAYNQGMTLTNAATSQSTTPLNKGVLNNRTAVVK